ncbi:hypothetical protein [Winogradskyella wichelsiae]|uniref:hypothetical protein n=1 Tax=Winogradskyella wichelsiae TaxID=2697007 RepID=UPI0015CAAE3A|nr:hypothetical protein [Winogradskyella wichelsiae]
MLSKSNANNQLPVDVCIISCYFKGNIIPKYLKQYILELSKYCSEIILVTTNKTFLKSFNRSLFKLNSLNVLFVKNEGYDFGMWYKAMQNINLESYNSILLTNDSCVLVNPFKPFFDWYSQQKSEYIGLVSSNENTYHYQSYFHVFKGNSIKWLYNKFEKEGLKDTYQDVVNDYELCMFSYLSANSIAASVMFDEGSKINLNPMFFSIDSLLNNNIPIVKRQLVFGFKRKNDLNYLKNLNFDLDSTQNSIKKLSKYGNEYI